VCVCVCVCVRVIYICVCAYTHTRTHTHTVYIDLYSTCCVGDDKERKMSLLSHPWGEGEMGMSE